MTEECLNLGAGKTIRLSSNARPTLPTADDVLTGTPGGDFSFHTHAEERPWLLVDLHRVLPVGRITLWNREKVGLPGMLRAVPLLIEHAAEEEAWQPLATIHHAFGGALSEAPFDLRLPHPMRTRFLRLTALGGGPLHLDKIHILSPGLPPEATFRYGQLRNLRFVEERPAADIAVTWNRGFFSNCSVALHMAVHAAARGFDIHCLDFSGSFRDFGNDGTSEPALFRTDTSVALPEVGDARRLFNALDVHQHYRDFRFPALASFIDRFFRPHPAVAAIEAALIAQHAIDLSRTLVILYRGTDKSVEIPPTDIAEYLALADRLLATRPDHRVCIQTDQQQIRERVRAHFGPRCFAFEALPVTEANVVIHRTDFSRYGLDRAAFGQTLLAAIHLLAQADIAITHTGNVGGWLALYRGHARNLYQFDRHQALVEPYP